MNNVNGFSTKNLRGKLNYKPKHFRLGDKDYLVFNVDGELKIMIEEVILELKIDSRTLTTIFLIKICLPPLTQKTI